MSYGNMSAATEALFDAEQTAESLLDAIRTNVNTNVNSIDAAAALENKLSEQAASFNQCLTTMANAYRKCEAGEITREQAMDECKPCVDALKSHCEALNLSGVNVGSGDITEEEIAMLREVITGAKDIVSARKRELEDCPVCAVKNSDASEGFLSSLGGMEPATEGSKSAMTVLGSPEKKSADQLYKSAKSLYSHGQEGKAVEYMTKAKKLYEKCVATAKKNCDWVNSERTVWGAGVSDKFKMKATTSISAGGLVTYLEDRVDSCQAWLIKWSNKAGNADYQTLKDQLKTERKEQRKAYKEAKKAAKAAKKNGTATEGYAYSDDPDESAALEEYFDALSEFESACEGIMDSCESELALYAAMEADGDTTPDETPKSPSGIGARLRAAFGKLKKSKASNDTQGMNEANAEIKAAVSDLEEASDDADPETKKKLSTAAKVGLAAAGAAAAVAGLTVAGQALKKNAEAGNLDPNKVGRLLINASNQVVRAKDATVAGAKLAGSEIQKAGNNVGAAMKRKFGKKVTVEGKPQPYTQALVPVKAHESWDISDLIANMAMESNLDDIMDEETKVQPQTGKAFDDDDIQGNHMIEEAEEGDAGEGCEDCEEEAIEAFALALAAEDGFAD